MSNSNFYCERKWCETCKEYVPYLMSTDHSFCVKCHSKVRIFSREDSVRFNDTIKRHKWQAS